MKVLIPSDNRDFVAELIAAYHDLGWEVVTGAHNFDLCSAHYDLVHYQWPEELTEWKPPTERRLGEMAERLQWWQNRCPSIVTAHNYYPHGCEKNEAFKILYEMFYHKCSIVQHFSAISKRLACNEFAGARHDRHVITTPWSFEHVLTKQQKRGSCRDEFSFRPDEFVILVMGALRSWEELQLISRAYSLCQVPKKRLLMVGRYSGSAAFLNKIKRLLWGYWLWRHNALVEAGYISDETLYRYLDTADVVVVPRVGDLSSGIPSLAITFGAMVIAPAHGAFPEYLEGTENLLYESGNARSLALAIEKSAAADRKRISASNRQKALEWRWNNVINDCLHALHQKQWTMMR
jgi:glycosyltransferase involved in cell wall biosynthesis